MTLLQGLAHAVELAERGTLRVAQEQLDAVARRELADDVVGVLDGLRAAAGQGGACQRTPADHGDGAPTQAAAR
jgi:hypothetical protein